MKKGLAITLVTVGIIAVAGAAFALSGVLPIGEKKVKVGESMKSTEPVAEEQNNTGDVKEIVIDDIDKMNVPVYEYAEKVIIEAPLKWITDKPGVFGKYLEQLGPDRWMDIKPDSLAVNSKGEIYILDTVNNRIQKFSGAGEYLKSIEVDSLKGSLPKGYSEESWRKERASLPSDMVPVNYDEVYLRGINIVIDSKDNLYYYMKRDLNTDNPKGEVWKFIDDKVVEKWEDSKLHRIGETIFIRMGDNIINPISNKIVDIARYKEEQKVNNKEKKERTKRREEEIMEWTKIKKENHNEVDIKLKMNNKRVRIKFKKELSIYPPLIPEEKDEIHIKLFQKYKGLYILYLDYDGNITGIYGTISWTGLKFQDTKGNIYEIDNEGDSFKVIKYEYQKAN